jgi:hypothetical protein
MLEEAAEKCHREVLERSKSIPQGLKPTHFKQFVGTTEVVPFQSTPHPELFRRLLGL